MKLTLPNAGEGDRRKAGRVRRTSWAFPVVALASMALASAFIVQSQIGMKGLVLALGGLVGLLGLAVLSFRTPTIAIAIWLFSMGGVRLVGIVSMPGLPDFSIDRLLLVWIMLLFLVKLVAGRQEMRAPFGADLLLLAHTLYILFNVQYTHSPHFNAWVHSSLPPFFAFLYGHHLIKSEKDVRTLLIFMMIMTAYFTFTAFAEQLGWRALIWPKQILDPDVGMWAPGRSRGPLVHPPVFGQVLSMLLLVVLYMNTRRLPAAAKIACVAMLPLTMLAQLFTYTRGPWLATLVALLALALLRAGYRRIILGLVGIGLVVGMLGLYRLANSEFLQERMENKGTVENRLSFLAIEGRMLRDYPLVGVGYLKSREYIEQYTETIYVPFYGMVRRGRSEGMVAHDIFLGRAVEEGLIGFGLMVAFYIAIWRAAVRQWKAQPVESWFNRDVLALMYGMMVTYMVGGMVIDYRYFDLVNVLFCLVAGVVYGYDSTMYERHNERSA